MMVNGREKGANSYPRKSWFDESFSNVGTALRRALPMEQTFGNAHDQSVPILWQRSNSQRERPCQQILTLTSTSTTVHLERVRRNRRCWNCKAFGTLVLEANSSSAEPPTGTARGGWHLVVSGICWVCPLQSLHLFCRFYHTPPHSFSAFCPPHRF